MQVLLSFSQLTLTASSTEEAMIQAVQGREDKLDRSLTSLHLMREMAR